MWTNLIANKKMIESIFPEGFDLGLPELVNISIDTNDIKVSFNLREFPETYPKKWDKKSFNAVRLLLEFGGIEKFSSSGFGFGWLESLDLKSVDGDRVFIEMAVNNFRIMLVSGFLTVRSVQPYDDVRWE